MKAVYVTGCLGFIGSYITRKCLDRGWHVKGVDKMTYASRKELLQEFNSYSNFSFVHCDINDLEFFYDCDYIINTAAETHVGNSIVSSKEFLKSNIDGVHNILTLLKNYRQENSSQPILLHFSTDEVYGDIESGEHVETDLLKPSNPYSATKASADMLILAWARTYGIKHNIIRPTNNYGIGQYVEKLIPKTVKFLSLGRKIPLHNKGTPIRNWLHADDTAEACMTIIDSGIENEIYNVCGGFEQDNFTTVSKIIASYIGVCNTNDYLDFSYNRAGQDIRYSLNDDKIRRLGWTPKQDFDKCITDIVKFYTNQFIW